MIELIFSDGGAAALMLAKSTGDTSFLTGVEITVDSDGNETSKEYAPEPYEGPRIHGDVNDVAAIWLMGDVGDISILPDWSSRMNILREISDIHAMEPEEWTKEESKKAEALMDRLEKAVQEGETFRVWWSELAHETCGYYWAMSILKDTAGKILSVKIPRFLERDGHVSIVNGTQDLEPGDFCGMLRFERAVEAAERKAIAAHWGKLVAENAPLRAVLNGIPCSVPEDFYDYLLYKVVPEKEFKVVDAIGRALWEGPGGISDWWLAQRLRHMIACGELEVVEGGHKFYRTTLRKVKG